MLPRPIRATVALAMLVALPFAAATAAPAEPAPTAILFDAQHLATTAKGDKLVYDLTRKVSEPKIQGEPFTDTITVDIANAEPNGTRDVVVHVMTGERARPPQAISGMTGNPLLVVFLDRAVNNLAMLAGGSRPFLKNKIKSSFVLNPEIAPAEITYKGNKVAGHWIKVAPFAGDPNALKMMGYDGMSLEIVVSDKVPGHFVNLASHYASPMKGSPRLDETITLEGVGEISQKGGK